MKALWLLRNGGLDALSVRDSPEPVPVSGEVRVRVHAAGLNFAEILIRQGLYADGPTPPAILGFDAAGVIDDSSASRNGPARGSRVALRTAYCGHAEYVCVPNDSVFPIPSGMTFAEAVALPITYATAYHALFRTTSLRPGDWVLIHAAGGGVGLAAVQLCNNVKDVTVIGTASLHKHSALLREGCAYAIDYHQDDYVRAVKQLTKGRGVDIILDSLGGTDTVRNYDLLNAEGRLICYGFLNLVCGECRNVRHVAQQARSIPSFNTRDLIAKNRTVSGLNLWPLNQRDLSGLAEKMQALLRLYEQKTIRPVVSEQYEFRQAGRGYARMQRGESLGKVVLAT